MPDIRARKLRPSRLVPAQPGLVGTPDLESICELRTAELGRSALKRSMPIVDDIAGLRRILLHSRTLAVVGLSAQWHRPSYFAAKYMRDHGYRIFPVNPRYDEVLGQRCYPDLRSVPEPVDIVDCFRKSEEIPPIADAAIAIGEKVLWMQLGIVNHEA